ncbi:MAG: stage V sporulation protein AD [Clostridia bacterium]|nr:stage V sporulation protein AD [Clostridia bacterium]
MGSAVIKLNSEILCAASAVGKQEYEGPLGTLFDLHCEDDRFGQDTWEKAESEMQRQCLGVALSKSGLREADIGALFAGDLINQCTGSSYGLLDYDIPYFGLYGACSTAIEGLMLSSIMTTTGIFDHCASVTSSHNCSAERQFRTPLEYGAQRAPTSQWTVTGSGLFITRSALQGSGKAKITEALPGISVEKGVTDMTNMGAAMAPAALDTLVRYFTESGSEPNDFDLIVTGDLGFEGNSILRDLLSIEGYETDERLTDCGMLIYDRNGQDMHAGGSGCGCSAVVLASYLLPKVELREINNMLILGTGALMSPDSIKQGLAIPGIAHLLRIESERS